MMRSEPHAASVGTVARCRRRPSALTIPPAILVPPISSARKTPESEGRVARWSCDVLFIRKSVSIHRQTESASGSDQRNHENTVIRSKNVTRRMREGSKVWAHQKLLRLCHAASSDRAFQSLFSPSRTQTAGLRTARKLPRLQYARSKCFHQKQARRPHRARRAVQKPVAPPPGPLC